MSTASSLKKRPVAKGGAAAVQQSPTQQEPETKVHSTPTSAKTKTFALSRTDWIALAIVTGLSFLTRLIWLGHPNEVVFDEVHFGGFTSNYMKGQYFFDIHPPLGKLLLALAGWLIGFDGRFAFAQINDKYPDGKYYWLRLGPAMAGSLIAPVAFLTAHHLSNNCLPASVMAAVLVITDLGFLCESKFILTDAYLFLFIALSYYTSLRAWHAQPWTKNWWLWTFLSAVALGCTVSVKWTGLCVVACVGLRHAWDVFQGAYRIIVSGERDISRPLGMLVAQAVTSASILLGTMWCIYLFSWWCHFHFLPNAGPGDVWHDELFRASLKGSLNEAVVAKYRPEQMLTFMQKFNTLQPAMFRANRDVSADHHWDSHWSYWPFMVEGVAYWWGKDDKILQHVYMMGNPFGWWLTTFVSVLYVGYSCYLGAIRTPMTQTQRDFLFDARFVFFGHLANWLPYGLVARSCFMYHYLPSIYFLYVLCGIGISYWTPEKLRWVSAAAVCALVSWAFWYWGPAVYALNLTEAEREERKWLSRWTL